MSFNLLIMNIKGKEQTYDTEEKWNYLCLAAAVVLFLSLLFFTISSFWLGFCYLCH
jgi:hypothetical protein